MLPTLSVKHRWHVRSFKATPIKPTKPIRRGNKGGLREVERTILKENKMI